MFNRMKAKLFAASLSVAGLTLGAIVTFGPVSAGAFETWCEDDPIISVNGQHVSVVVGVPTSQVQNLASVQVTFHVPRNVDADIVYVGKKLPEQATIVKDQTAWNGRDRIEIEIDVLATSKAANFWGHVIVTDNTGNSREDRFETGRVLHDRTSVKLPEKHDGDDSEGSGHGSGRGDD